MEAQLSLDAVDTVVTELWNLSLKQSDLIVQSKCKSASFQLALRGFRGRTDSASTTQTYLVSNNC
jgi:hypothetical protein